MKISKLIIILVSGAAIFSACDKKEEVTNELLLTNQIDSVSYALAINVMDNVQKSGMTDVNPVAVAAGIEAVMDSSAVMTKEEANEVLNAYFGELQKAKTESMTKEGRDFLAENSMKEGVQTTASGLQYRVITEGTGVSPGPTSEVTVHYQGTLVDGTEFDSSFKRGEPIQFRLNGVIRGWTEGLQLMKEGAEYEFFIPYDLAYGPQGRPGIPPYATLIFKVQLLKVNN